MRWLALLLLVPLVGAYGPLGDADGDGVGDFMDGPMARSGVTGEVLWTSDGRITIDANQDGVLDLLRTVHHDTHLLSGTDLKPLLGPWQARSLHEGTPARTVLLGEDSWSWLSESHWLLPGHLIEVTSTVGESSKYSLGTGTLYVGEVERRNVQELYVHSILGEDWSWKAPEGRHVENQFQVGPDLSGDGVPDLLLTLFVEQDQSTRSIWWLDTSTGEPHLFLEEPGNGMLDAVWASDKWLLVQGESWRTFSPNGLLLAEGDARGEVIASLETGKGALLQTETALVDERLQATPYHHEWDGKFRSPDGDRYLTLGSNLELRDAETGKALWSRPMGHLQTAQGFDDGLLVSAQDLDHLLITALHPDGSTSWTQYVFPVGPGKISLSRVPDMTQDGIADLLVQRTPPVTCGCSEQAALLDAADGTLLVSRHVEHQLSPIANIHGHPPTLLGLAPLAALGLIRRLYLL